MTLLDRTYALTVMTRLAARRPALRGRLREALAGRVDQLAPLAVQVAIETGDPIGSVLADVLQDRPYAGLLERLGSNLPPQSTALRELALLVIRRQYEAEVYQKTLRTRAEFYYAAKLLAQYAVRLGDVGRLTPSINTNAVALQLLEQAGTSDSTASLRAEVLHNMADSLANMGDFERALTFAEMAIECHRVVVARGEEPIFQLADAISGAATIRMSAHRFEDAKPMLEEALALLIGAGDTSVGARLIHARLRNNLAVIKGHFGDHAGALVDFNLAVEEGRALAEAQPDAIRPYLARYLVGRAKVHRELSQVAAAKQDIGEGLAIWEALGSERPDAFNNDYLLALEAEAELAIGREVAAPASAPEHMVQQLRLARLEPGRWRLWWSRLARQLLRETAEGDWETMSERSDEILLQLAKSQPMSEGDADDEVELLLITGIAHRRCGRYNRSIAAAERALFLLENRSGEGADTRRTQVFEMLGGFLADDGRIDEAASMFRLAFSGYAASGSGEKLAQAAHIAFETIHEQASSAAAVLLNEALSMCAGLCDPAMLLEISARRTAALAEAAASEGTDGGDAVAEAERSIQLVSGDTPIEMRLDAFRWLSQAGDKLVPITMARHSARALFAAARASMGEDAATWAPDVSVEYFAHLFSQARTMIAWEEPEAALALLQRSVVLHKARRTSWPAEPPLGLAASWDAVARVVAGIGDTEYALQAGRQAVAAYAEAYDLDNGASGSEYAIGLNNLSNRLWAAGLQDESFEIIIKCLLLIEGLPPELVAKAARVKAIALGSLLERGSALGRPLEALMRRFIGVAPSSE